MWVIPTITYSENILNPSTNDTKDLHYILDGVIKGPSYMLENHMT